MSIVPKKILKGPIGQQGQVGPTGYPGFSLSRLSDLDHELIKFLDWIQHNCTLAKERNNVNEMPVWRKEGEKVYYYLDSENLLRDYKKFTADAKH
jgi:hypothetical protein